MAIVRWDPFRDFFGRGSNLGPVFGRWVDEDDTKDSAWRPAVDIFERDDGVVMRAELPGMDKGDIKIGLENGVLTLRGERKLDEEVKRESYHRVERSYGSFCRSFTLPSEVDRGKIEARFASGVLEVTLPRSEEAKPKQIEIKVN